MPTVQVPVELTVEHLMAVVKQLSPAELHEFMQQLDAWQQHNGQQAEEEVALLARIKDKESSRLPTAEQRRFDRLRRKRQAGTLTKPEAAQLRTLWQHVEQMNVTRLQALTALAQRRHTDVKTCMRELGLAESPNVF
jgi:hypothetical protein